MAWQHMQPCRFVRDWLVATGWLQLEINLLHIPITTPATAHPSNSNICHYLYLIASVTLQKSCSPAALWLSSNLRPVRRCHYCHQDFCHACSQHKMHHKQCCSCLLLLCFTVYNGLIWSELGRSIHGLICLGNILGVGFTFWFKPELSEM